MELCIKKFSELNTAELYEILKIRVNVFVVEQNCPYPEIDDLDKSSLHIYLRDEEGIFAYLRVMEKTEDRECVSIGRVLSLKRRHGYASLILSEGIKAAKEYYGADKIYLEAQTYVKSLYEKHGFVQISDEFLEDGIAHVAMLLDI